MIEGHRLTLQPCRETFGQCRPFGGEGLLFVDLSHSAADDDDALVAVVVEELVGLLLPYEEGVAEHVPENASDAVATTTQSLQH